MAQVCDPGCDDFNRLQRRIDAADRTYHRTLVTLQKIESLAPDFPPPAPESGSFTPHLPTNRPDELLQIPTKTPV